MNINTVKYRRFFTRHKYFFHTCVASSQWNVPLESIKEAIYKMSKYLSKSVRRDGTFLQSCYDFAHLHKRVRCSKDFTEIRYVKLRPLGGAQFTSIRCHKAAGPPTPSSCGSTRRFLYQRMTMDMTSITKSPAVVVSRAELLKLQFL